MDSYTQTYTEQPYRLHQTCIHAMVLSFLLFEIVIVTTTLVYLYSFMTMETDNIWTIRAYLIVSLFLYIIFGFLVYNLILSNYVVRWLVNMLKQKNE